MSTKMEQYQIIKQVYKCFRQNQAKTFIVKILIWRCPAASGERTVTPIYYCSIFVRRVVTNMPHAAKCGARATKSGAYATKCKASIQKLWHIKEWGICHETWVTCHKKLRHVSHKVVAHASKSCGTCPEKL